MFKNVRQLHIEPTSLCNAECPMCARNVNGVGLNPHITLKSLTKKWFKDNLAQEQVEKLQKIFFCGNVGDPAATPELLEIIEYLKSVNPDIVIGINTNGGLKTPSWWSRLGQLLDGNLDYCVFSIGGLEDTNHIYRRNVNWNKIMENAESFISTGASAHWDMLVFKHNNHQVDEARKLADRMKFTWFRTKETDRWDTYTTGLGLLPPGELTPPSYGKNVSCEKDRDHSMFLDYTGKLWPCCHMAEAYLNKIGEELHKDIKEFSNQQLLTEYKTRLENHEPFFICRRACGKHTGKRSQWKKEEKLR